MKYYLISLIFDVYSVCVHLFMAENPVETAFFLIFVP